MPDADTEPRTTALQWFVAAFLVLVLVALAVFAFLTAEDTSVQWEHDPCVEEGELPVTHEGETTCVHVDEPLRH